MIKNAILITLFILLVHNQTMPVFADTGIVNLPGKQLTVTSKPKTSKLPQKIETVTIPVENQQVNIFIKPSFTDILKLCGISALLIFLLFLFFRLLFKIFKGANISSKAEDNTAFSEKKEPEDITEAVSSYVKHKFYK